MKAISLAIALAAVLLAFAASPALAHEFTSSPEKSGFLGKGGTQTITLGGHTITCKAAKITGHATHELLSMGVSYEACEAFSTSAKISEADYTLNANGTGGIAAKTQTTITIKPSAEAECVYTLPETSKAVASVSYSNKEAGIAISPALKELTYELKEKGTAVCGTNGEKSTKGEYKGEVTTETYEAAKCIYWGAGGFRFESTCAIEGAGLYELVSGYKTLKWS